MPKRLSTIRDVDKTFVMRKGEQKQKMKHTRIRRIIAVLLCVSVMLPTALSNKPVQAEDRQSDLPEDIIENKISFDTVDTVIEKYKTEFSNREIDPIAYKSSINGENRVRRINFYFPEEPLQVNGECEIPIPEEIARILRLFGDVRYTGSIADSGTCKMYIVDPDGKEHLLPNYGQAWKGEFSIGGEPQWTSYGKTSANESSLMNPTEHKVNGEVNYTGYKLKFLGTGSLNFINLWEENGLPMEYDTSAYGVIGSDKDVIDATVSFDATKNLSIDGVNKMEDDVFKRVHVNSGPVQVFSNMNTPILDDEVFSKTYRDWKFTPGRGTFQIKDAGGLLTEGADGYSNTDALFESYALNPVMVDKLNTLFPATQDDYILTYDGWPEWQWGELGDINIKNINMATPDYKYFKAAADTAAKLTKAIDTRFDGYGPRYIEVKNESTFSGEWAFFNTCDEDTAWNYLAEFHNEVADAIKKEVPEVLVGGPSSAFMYIEKDDFKDAFRQLKFMDDTKGHLDWYSHHFYENSASLYVNGREENSDGFLCGRFQAVMDLLRAHMENTDNVRPILITEEGSYNSLNTDIDYFQNLTAFNGYFIQSLEYVDTIDSLIPYLYPVCSWRPNGNNQLYKYNEGQTGILEEMTPLEAYVDMWTDFNGAFIPASISTDDPVLKSRIYTKAVRQGDTIYLAVQNLNNQQVNLDIEGILGNGIQIENISEKHYFLENAKLTYEEIMVDDLNDIHMRVQEMAMFEIKVSDAAEFVSEVYKEVDYAREELVETGNHMEFTVESSKSDLVDSTIRVGFGKSGSGFAGTMTISLNGKVVGNRDLEYTNKTGDIFTTADFDIDPAEVKEGTNKIVVSMPEGGRVSCVSIINNYDKAAAACADAAPLKVKIEEALNMIGDKLYLSEDGSGLPAGAKWITQINFESFTNVITDACALLKDVMRTDKEIQTQLKILDTAMTMFSKNSKDAVVIESEAAVFPDTTFEEGEDVSYIVTNGKPAESEIITENNNSVLKVTVPKMGSWNDLTQVVWTAADGEYWDLMSNHLTFDIGNPNEYTLYYAVNIYDTEGGLTQNWLQVAAGETKHVELIPAAPANFKNAAKVAIWINEPHMEMKDKENVSFILDNVCVIKEDEEPTVLVKAERPDVDTTIVEGLKLPEEPEIIEGANAVWDNGTKGNLIIKSDALFADFIKVTVNGTDLNSECYEVSEGSTVVTLKESYLDGLEAGVYNIAIVSKSGIAETTFTIKRSEKPDGGETDDKELVSIEITKEPNKKIYQVGEKLDITGMEVMARYEDGTTELISGYQVKGFDSSKSGDIYLTVVYEGKSCRLKVTIRENAGSETVKKPDVIKTGDESRIFVAVVALVLSAIVLLMLLLRKRLKK